LLTIVLAQRPFPDQIDFDAVLLEVLHGFDRAGVNALPEFMRRALRNDGDVVGLRAGIGFAATENEDQRQACEKKESCFHELFVRSG